MNRDIAYYINLFPAWMKEDVSFLEFYSSIAAIFVRVHEIKEKILSTFLFTNTKNEESNYSSNVEVLSSYFGISRNFYLTEGIKVMTGRTRNIFDNPYRDKDTGDFYTVHGKDINIKISNKILLRLIKFKLLKNSFDGTIKNLI